jgi:transcriptional regulator with XRE-family HTH domain
MGAMALKFKIRELIDQKSKAEGRKITQKEVAQAADIDPAVLSRYANGFTNSFQGEVVEKLMDYFEVSLDELIYRDKIS